MLDRTAGILLHPTSLPGPYGIGDLGPIAHTWIDTLAAMKQSWWQVLPLGPTGFGDSPYQSYSAFAGNPLLISPQALIADGLLPKTFTPPQKYPEDHVEFESVSPMKQSMIRSAYDAFRAGRSQIPRDDFESFRQREAAWLEDYALFMVIRSALGGASLADWPAELRTREPAALDNMRRLLANEVILQQFAQFLFDRQWTALKAYANSKHIRILGDVPIFVAPDSADVWANPEFFLLDDEGRPKVVAGVPPDYFAKNGQRWGNPIYDWPAIQADGFRWWIDRVRHALRQADLLRLDHFRGFVQAWHIPANAATAKNGRWVDGPGRPLFDALRSALGGLPFIAEDLGLITPDVIALRDALGLPGMRVLQFMLTGPQSVHQPHNYEANTACYTGTHDNDTSVGWYAQLTDKEKWDLGDYVGHAVTNPAWELIRLAWSSVARLAIAPLQDVFSLGGEARMNVPGQQVGNWRWRFTTNQFEPRIVDWMAGVTARYARGY